MWVKIAKAIVKALSWIVSHEEIVKIVTKVAEEKLAKPEPPKAPPDVT